MKKTILTLTAAMFAMMSWAQSNAELGKKWFEAERYDKALVYLEKAIEEGDIDSKARLATMIFTMQVPEYSMDQMGALDMLDECIAEGSVYALERKGFCQLIMGNDTKEAKLEALDLLQQASDKGNGDASFELMKVYMEGLKTYSDHETIVAIDEEKMVELGKKACEQGNVQGIAWVGYWMASGSHGFEKDAAQGIAMIAKANDTNMRMVAADCVEPAKMLISNYKRNGKAAKVAPLEKLMKQYHPDQR